MSMEMAEEDRSPVWAGKSVLIVDDYSSIRKTMRELVQGLGLVSHEAENGLQALEALRTAAADLIISDLVMPEMDGFELTEAVKTSPRWRSIPVVILSTHADARYIFKALRLGADDYLTKPAGREMLITVLNRIFDHDWE
jgi:CheY-like chemotaxis protein